MIVLKELEVPADMSHLDEVMGLINELLDKVSISDSDKMKVELAVEEMFTNIASYAYEDDNGYASVTCKLTDHPGEIVICFSDTGKPYNPLLKPDPDVEASADERPIGGLGIFMTKKIMDNITYEYKDNKNVLTISKNFD